MPLPVFTLQTFIISLATGAVGALLGLGGGVFMVPLLVFLLGVPLQVAAGASILAVLATSIAAASKNVKDDMTNLRLGLFLELATTLGALMGAFAVPFVSDQILRIVFGLTLVYASGIMFHQIRKTGRSWTNAPNDELAERLNLGGSYYDAARGETVEYGVSRTPATLAVSYVAGILSGLLGIGGGGVKVPAMNVVGNIPMKAAVATSNFMIGVTAAASALVYIRNQYCDAFIAAPVVLGTLIGATIGARYNNRVKGVALKKTFIVMLFIVAIRMILSGVGI
jgi:uncharacterized membrane protein YfcA